MTYSAEVECIVVGAGVVGLAAARALALAGREVVVLEAERAIGTGISSRNSGVIHAGIYYAPGSLKARFCVEGRKLLYDYCRSRAVPHARLGKIIVASSQAQRPQLLALMARAKANGVDDLVLLERDEIRALEPDLQGDVALLSPSTGILDVHALMLSLQGDIEACGGTVALQAPVAAGAVEDGRLVIETGGADPARLTARQVVLSAGLATPRLARSIAGLAAGAPGQHAAKGNYFSLSGRTPFQHLIYPMPEPGGLGIHLTLDLAGRGRFGPDVEWLDLKPDETIDYAVDPGRAARFYAAIRTYWPGLKDGALAPDFAGVRPKLVGAGEKDADFVIQDEKTHGARGLVALYGIESPGLTSSLAIAEQVARILSGQDARMV